MHLLLRIEWMSTRENEIGAHSKRRRIFVQQWVIECFCRAETRFLLGTNELYRAVWEKVREYVVVSHCYSSQENSTTREVKMIAWKAKQNYHKIKKTNLFSKTTSRPLRDHLLLYSNLRTSLVNSRRIHWRSGSRTRSTGRAFASFLYKNNNKLNNTPKMLNVFWKHRYSNDFFIWIPAKWYWIVAARLWINGWSSQKRWYIPQSHFALLSRQFSYNPQTRRRRAYQN